MKKCGSITSGGQRCQRIIKDSEDYCFGHDPTRAEQRKQLASNAAKAKNAGDELVQVKAELRDIAAKVRSGELTTARGSVTAQVLGVFIRACEVERKAKEEQLLEELKQRMANVEMRAKNSTKWSR